VHLIGVDPVTEGGVSRPFYASSSLRSPGETTGLRCGPPRRLRIDGRSPLTGASDSPSRTEIVRRPGCPWTVLRTCG
jgi:hypothetical protein